MWYLRSLEHASVIQKLAILEHKNGLVLSNTCVPVSWTWSILFPRRGSYYLWTLRILEIFIYTEKGCFIEFVIYTLCSTGNINAVRIHYKAFILRLRTRNFFQRISSRIGVRDANWWIANCLLWFNGSNGFLIQSLKKSYNETI